jgi:hypothetical protein
VVSALPAGRRARPVNPWRSVRIAWDRARCDAPPPSPTSPGPVPVVRPHSGISSTRRGDCDPTQGDGLQDGPDPIRAPRDGGVAGRPPVVMTGAGVRSLGSSGVIRAEPLLEVGREAGTMTSLRLTPGPVRRVGRMVPTWGDTERCTLRSQGPNSGALGYSPVAGRQAGRRFWCHNLQEQPGSTDESMAVHSVTRHSQPPRTWRRRDTGVQSTGGACFSRPTHPERARQR